ncbi:hypothetical protein BDD26_2704 [Xenorhabdus cabanillasii]|uniref:Uncharacterized protein n=1 Tax=Xenorhabdus cabanillasii TaxID=351673 RepID=A0A3D9UEF2_9GAMM|nr:hypothetical protein [Xenorhabdus cabanillasii]REF27878.1 hypothetical protein BDD26_2704 [Xenorhabdus cabanillasii]
MKDNIATAGNSLNGETLSGIAIPELSTHHPWPVAVSGILYVLAEHYRLYSLFPLEQAIIPILSG